MGTSQDRFDVAVVGGGLIGLGIAWRCAQRGASVCVFDPRPGRAASWAGAGMLAPVTEAHYGEEALLALNLEAARRYADDVNELIRESGADVGYRRSGTVTVARDADDNAALEDLFSYQRELGLTVRRLRSREVRDLEPSLAPSVRGGIHVEGDHQVDNRALVQALDRACRKQGVVVAQQQVAAIEPGAACMVHDAGGESVKAGAIVVAAGAWSESIAATAGAPLPVRPVKGQLLHLRERSGTALLERNVRGLDVYLVPRSDGRIVVGATVEEQGFDVSPTAGGVLDLLRYAYEVVPGVTEMELVEVAVGLRPGSPDNAPLIGPLGVDGVFAATGHYRNGILLWAVTARAIAKMVLGEGVDELVKPFGPTRFESVAA